MTGTAKGSLALYTEVASLVAPNGNGAVTASVLAGVFNDLIASYPNTTDGLGGYANIGTVTGGLWNGTTIGLGYGGTGASLTASVGGIAYSTSGAMAILAGTATAGQMLQSGASAAPSWSTTTWPATVAINQLLYTSAANVVSGLAMANGGILNASASGVPSITPTPTLGVAGSTAGTLSLSGATGGKLTLASTATVTSYTLTFPSAAGSSGQLLQNAGSGSTQWTTATYPTAVANGSLLVATAANVVSALAPVNNAILNTTPTGTPTLTPTPTLGLAGAASGAIILAGFTSGSVTLGVPSAAGGGTAFTFPNNNGAAGYFAQTDGAGNVSWQPAPISIPDGRLTLTSGTPVMTGAGVSGATTVYFTPYMGGVEPLWNGSTFVPTQCSELSNILANSSVGNAGPAATAANNCYDLFVWNNGGAPTLTRGPAWTGSSRGTGAGTSQLSRQNGILVNQYAIVIAGGAGPAAGFGTYVGTVATDSGAGTVSFKTGGPSTAGALNVWNMYNRVLVGAAAVDTAGSYAYEIATLRQAHGQTYNQVSFVIGFQEDAVCASLNVECQTASAIGAKCVVGIGTTTSAIASTRGVLQTPVAYYLDGGISVAYAFQPSIGVSTLYSLELGDGSNNNTFDFQSGNQLAVMMRV